MNLYSKNNLAVKKGSAGEEAALYWFKLYGWTMFRTQPETKCIGLDSLRRPLLIYAKGKGIADYTGYRGFKCGCGDLYQVYTACECKVHGGDNMPASVLSSEQRDWMRNNVPPGSGFVFILWDDGRGEIHPFIYMGSYKKGQGLGYEQ
jgi:hypothetical protein